MRLNRVILVLFSCFAIPCNAMQLRQRKFPETSHQKVLDLLPSSREQKKDVEAARRYEESVAQSVTNCLCGITASAALILAIQEMCK